MFLAISVICINFLTKPIFNVLMRKKMSWRIYDKAINRIVSKINEHGKKYDKILTFKRGGLIPSASLAFRLNISEIGTIPDTKPDVDTLVVDDISDSGETLGPFANYDTACLYYKKGTRIIPKFFYKSCNKDVWIVFPWERGEENTEIRDRDKAEKNNK